MFKQAEKTNKISDNVYFKNLESLPLADFYNTQKEFVSAIDNWSKALALLLAKLPSYKERLVILKNLNDENGDGNPDNSHVVTFHKFLQQVNPKHDFEMRTNNGVSKFNEKLNYYIKDRSWKFSCAIIGMIEYTYITISRLINKYVTKYKKVEYHYSAHEILDVDHYRDLFNLVKDDYDKNEDIRNGLQTGYDLFEELYNNLYLRNNSL
jgi:hypothetical protein